MHLNLRENRCIGIPLRNSIANEILLFRPAPVTFPILQLVHFILDSAYSATKLFHSDIPFFPASTLELKTRSFTPPLAFDKKL